MIEDGKNSNQLTNKEEIKIQMLKKDYGISNKVLGSLFSTSSRTIGRVLKKDLSLELEEV